MRVDNLSNEKIKLITVTLLLVLIGFIFVFSAGSMQALRIGKSETYFFFKQFIASIIGVLTMIAVYRIPLEFYRKAVFVIYLMTLFLLLAVFVFPAINGSHRWIVFQLINLQPSEIAKFTTILYLAHYLDKKQDKLKDFSRGFLPASILLGILASLIMLEPDFGTTFLLMLLAFTLLFVGGINVMHILGAIFMVIPILVTLIMMGDYRKMRFISFLNPWEYKDTVGYQLIQSLTAVGSGGLFGKGLGNSSQKLYFLPEAHTDFIYSIIAEEFGFIGAVIVLILICYIFYISFKIAFMHKDRYKRLLTLGIAFLIIYQAIIHIGVAIGMLPTKGITLPLISYGGSALIFQLGAIGILLRSVKELQ
ncbi:MAG: cell division protein FtsW [Deferribacteres bacterium]|jgi:cell division protein FtsW|nr:cell cycle protein [Deferribacteraceae bacterium]MDK2792385.1 cell division protein FtsW [Deferribacteres bacterium]